MIASPLELAGSIMAFMLIIRYSAELRINSQFQHTNNYLFNPPPPTNHDNILTTTSQSIENQDHEPSNTLSTGTVNNSK